MVRNFEEVAVPGFVKVLIGIVIALFAVGIFAYNSITRVYPGEVGILVTNGSPADRISEPGLVFGVPFMSYVDKFSTRTINTNISAQAGSADLQQVGAIVSVNWNIGKDNVLPMYLKYKSPEKIEDSLIMTVAADRIRATTSKYTVEQLITKRDEVTKTMLEAITAALKPLDVNVVTVSSVNFQLSKDYNDAIERKVKTEQDSITEKNKLEQIKYQAQQAVVKAQGDADATLAAAKAEAEAIKIKSQAVTSQGGADYVKLKWIEKWNGALPVTTFGANAVPMVDFRDGAK